MFCVFVCVRKGEREKVRERERFEGFLGSCWRIINYVVIYY